MKLLLASHFSQDIGLTVLRVGIGFIFVLHGYPKMIGGTQIWLWLGTQMANVGITFIPVFWGLCAALSEFAGGLALVAGFGTRIAASFMAFTMVIATVHHVSKGDSFMQYSTPLSLLLVFVVLVIAGSGSYSVDQYLFG